METYSVEKPTFTFGWGDAPSGYGYSLADEDLFGPSPLPQSADKKADGENERERPLLRGSGEHLRLSGELVRPLEPVASPQIREATHTVVVNEGAAAALRAKVFGTAPLGIEYTLLPTFLQHSSIVMYESIQSYSCTASISYFNLNQ